MSTLMSMGGLKMSRKDLEIIVGYTNKRMSCAPSPIMIRCLNARIGQEHFMLSNVLFS